MLRTSLIATFTDGGSGHPAAGVSGENGQGHKPGQEERRVEWPIELQEGDSAAAAAREFVAERLGLAVRPKGTAPEVVAGGASSAHGGELGEENPRIAQHEVGGAPNAEGERVVQWVTKHLETELAERQVRGGGGIELCFHVVLVLVFAGHHEPCSRSVCASTNKNVQQAAARGTH